jgi:hypothetical protein
VSGVSFLVIPSFAKNPRSGQVASQGPPPNKNIMLLLVPFRNCNGLSGIQ